jgi:hypothetical protein
MDLLHSLVNFMIEKIHSTVLLHENSYVGCFVEEHNLVDQISNSFLMSSMLRNIDLMTVLPVLPVMQNALLQPLKRRLLMLLPLLLLPLLLLFLLLLMPLLPLLLHG